MLVARVRHRHELRVGDGEAEFRRGGVAVGEQASAVIRIDPGARHHFRAVGGRDGIARLDVAAHVGGGDDAFLDQQFLQRDAEDLVVGMHLVVGLRRRVRVFMIVVIVVMMVVWTRAHGSFSSQCS